MYIPSSFSESATEPLLRLIRDCPLATLVTTGESGLDANHIPMIHVSADGRPGQLRGHIARANPLGAALAGTDTEALAIFHGPEAYVSPSWYPEKKVDGKVVPTWNYVVVHVRGRLKTTDDPVWLRSLLETLTADSETGMPQPWAVSDAPAEYVSRMMRGIIGIELEIASIEGKWKASQNKTAETRSAVISGLEEAGSDAMAQIIRQQLQE